MPRDVEAEARYRELLDHLTEQAGDDFRAWAEEFLPDELSGEGAFTPQLVEFIDALVAFYGEQAGFGAGEYLYLQRQLHPELSQLDAPQVVTSVQQAQVHAAAARALSVGMGSAGESLYRHEVVRRISGVLTRLVSQPARQTIERATIDAGTRYARVPEAGACDFCLMLASRGAVYLVNEGKRRKDSMLAYHDHCRCDGIEVVDWRKDLPRENIQLHALWESVKVHDFGGSAASLDMFRQELADIRDEYGEWTPAGLSPEAKRLVGYFTNAKHPKWRLTAKDRAEIV